MTEAGSRRRGRGLSCTAAVALAVAACPSVLLGQSIRGVEGDAWIAGGAAIRAIPSEIDEITPWVEWRATARHERFAVNGTLSFGDRAFVQDLVLADQTPVARVTGPASDLVVGLSVRADVQILGRGTIASGAAGENLVPADAGTVLGLFARGEGGPTFIPDQPTSWDYRLGLGFGALNRFHGVNVALWIGQTGRLDDRFDVSTPSRGGVTLEYIGPRVLWPRFFLRVDGSTPFRDRAAVSDVPGLEGDLIDELEFVFGVVVPIIPRDL